MLFKNFSLYRVAARRKTERFTCSNLTNYETSKFHFYIELLIKQLNFAYK